MALAALKKIRDKKKQKKSQEQKTGDSSSGSNKPSKKQLTAFSRMSKDFGELEPMSFFSLNEEDKKNRSLLDFRFTLSPEEGYWLGGTFHFRCQVPDDYPYKPPKITCRDKIYHPNLDLQGNVCLNILRKDWRPILDLQSIIHGLVFLFTEPNPNDPLNQDAAKVLRDNESQFRSNVRRAMQGKSVDGETFQRVLK
eukprot:CAMPEP_0114499782 /NCGR_PEP_ID=MMETSP0109-20121206/7607_1 /TAXON_ID=29199 /ORGANISM="Chlorarachnion reptans, Strain CCCM449" /LENGTH=195 /DNA_ID=CAMNT_0001677385 /DNA_START=78 /DNA_END=665 /DNA_ORIENTATION=-